MNELSKKNDIELRKMLFEKRRLWHEFRFGAAGSRVRNTREGRHLRRDTARILTEMRKRKISMNTEGNVKASIATNVHVSKKA